MVEVAKDDLGAFRRLVRMRSALDGTLKWVQRVFDEVRDAVETRM